MLDRGIVTMRTGFSKQMAGRSGPPTRLRLHRFTKWLWRRMRRVAGDFRAMTRRARRTISNHPLLVAILGILGGYSVPGSPWTHALLPGILLTLCAIAKARTITLAITLGFMCSSATVAPPGMLPIARPGIYEIEGVVGRTQWSGYGGRRITFHVRRVGRWRAAAPVPIALDIPSDWRSSLKAVFGRTLRVVSFVTTASRSVNRNRATERGATPSHELIAVVRPANATREFIERTRARVGKKLRSALSRDAAALAQAFTVGHRDRIRPRARDLFRQTGQAHLLAVSGLHVGLLLAAALFVLRWLLVPRPWQWATAVALIVLYVPLTGPAPSAIRAGLGASLFALASLVRRRPSGWISLLGAGSIILLHRPSALSEVSLQLSFLAVGTIMWLTPTFERLLLGETLFQPPFQRVRRAPIRRMFAVSLAAWLGTLPIVATVMGRVCLAGPLLSLASLPLTALLLSSALILLVAPNWPIITVPIVALHEFSYELLTGMMDWATRFELQARHVTAPSVAWWITYLMCLFFLPLVSMRHTRKLIGVLALLIASLFLYSPLPSSSDALVANMKSPKATHANVRHAHYTSRTESSPRSTTRFTHESQGSPSRLSPHIASQPLPPLALAGVAVLLCVFAWLSVALARVLTRGGAACAVGLGMLTAWRFGFPGLAALFTAFLLGSVLGRLPRNKLPSPVGDVRGRTWKQVVANGAIPALGCALHGFGWQLTGVAVFLGSVACLAADTTATEIGTRFGGIPRNILTGAKLDPGQSGGVTGIGLVASLLAALSIPCIWCGVQGVVDAQMIGLFAGSGVLGGLVDSLLGASFQYLGSDPQSGSWTESVDSQRVRGWRWMDNNAVNLVSAAVAALTAVALTGLWT